MKKTLYGIAILIFGIILFGTVGALETDTIGFGTASWQAAVSIFGMLLFWNLLKAEETKVVRRRH